MQSNYFPEIITNFVQAVEYNYLIYILTPIVVTGNYHILLDR